MSIESKDFLPKTETEPESAKTERTPEELEAVWREKQKEVGGEKKIESPDVKTKEAETATKEKPIMYESEKARYQAFMNSLLGDFEDLPSGPWNEKDWSKYDKTKERKYEAFKADHPLSDEPEKIKSDKVVEIEKAKKIWEEKQAETEPMTEKESAEELTPKDIDRFFEMHGKAVDSKGEICSEESSMVKESDRLIKEDVFTEKKSEESYNSNTTKIKRLLDFLKPQNFFKSNKSQENYKDEKISLSFLEKNELTTQEVKEKIEQLKTTAEYISYHENNCGYNFSKISSTDKYSDGYSICSGLVVSGLDKDTGERISFLSHQNPSVRNEEAAISREKIFKHDLIIYLEDIINKIDTKSAQAVIFGGVPSRDGLEMKNMLTKIVKKKMGKDPIVVNPKQENADGLSAIYDNKKNSLTLINSMNLN